MICPVCSAENKEAAKLCRTCSADLNVEPLWKPTWKWHLKTLGVIYVVLVVVYFAISEFLSTVPEPYRLRDIPDEVRPWLK